MLLRAARCSIRRTLCKWTLRTPHRGVPPPPTPTKPFLPWPTANARQTNLRRSLKKSPPSSTTRAPHRTTSSAPSKKTSASSTVTKPRTKSASFQSKRQNPTTRLQQTTSLIFLTQLFLQTLMNCALPEATPSSTARSSTFVYLAKSTAVFS